MKKVTIAGYNKDSVSGNGKVAVLNSILDKTSNITILDITSPFSVCPTIKMLITQGKLCAYVEVKSTYFSGSYRDDYTEYNDKIASLKYNIAGEGYFEGHLKGHCHISKLEVFEVNEERFASLLQADSKYTLKTFKTDFEANTLIERIVGSTKTRIINSRSTWSDNENKFRSLEDIDFYMSASGDEFDYDTKSYNDYYITNVYKEELIKWSAYANSKVDKDVQFWTLRLIKAFKGQLADAIMDARVQLDEDFISKRMFLVENSPIMDIAEACSSALQDNMCGAYLSGFENLSVIQYNPFIKEHHDINTVCLNITDRRTHRANFKVDEYGSPMGTGDWDDNSIRLGWKYDKSTLVDVIDDFIVTGWGQPERDSVHFGFTVKQDEIRGFGYSSRYHYERSAFDIQVRWVNKTKSICSYRPNTGDRQAFNGWGITYRPFESKNSREYETSTAKKLISKVIPEGLESLFDRHSRSVEANKTEMIAQAEKVRQAQSGDNFLVDAGINTLDNRTAKRHYKSESGVYSVYITKSNRILVGLTEEQMDAEYVASDKEDMYLLKIDTRHNEEHNTAIPTATVYLDGGYGRGSFEVENVIASGVRGYIVAMVLRMNKINKLYSDSIQPAKRPATAK